MRQICLLICWMFLVVNSEVAAQQSHKIIMDTTGLDSARGLWPVHVHARSLPFQFPAIHPMQVLNADNPGWKDGLSVADAIRYFSGVQLKDYGGVGGLKTIDVHSMGTNHSAIYFNGVPLENVQNGQVDLGKYALDNLEDITLFSGQSDQLFQPARAYGSGASIFLRSKMPALDSSHSSKSTVALKMGSYGLWAPSLFTALRLSSAWRLSFSGGGLFSKGDYPFTYTNTVYDTTLRRSNSDVKSYHGSLGLEADFKDSSQLRINVYGFRRQMGLPGAIVSNRFDNRERQDESNYFVQADYKKTVTRDYSMALLFKYNKETLSYRNPEIQRIYIKDGDTLQGPLINHYRQSSLYGSMAHVYSITKRWKADISADFVYDRLLADLYGFQVPSRWTAYIVMASSLELGRWHFDGNILSTMVHDRTESGQPAAGKNEWTPALSFDWQPFTNQAFKLRGFYKRIFRMPTFNDLYYTQFGNISLKPEFVTTYDLGLSYYKGFKGILQSIYLQVDGYFNEVKDKIVAIPTTSLFRWQMANLGNVRVRGLDFSGKAVLSKGAWQLTTGLNYSFQKAQDYTDPGSLVYKNQIPYIPEHSGSLEMNLGYKNYRLMYSFIYDGERYSSSYNSLLNYVPAWYTHDLAVFYDCTLRDQKMLEFSLAIDNALDQHYDVIMHYPMPGRNYKMGIAFKF